MWKYRKRKKSKFLIILFAFVVSISLGYAYLERNLNINGSSYLAGNTWKINFENFVVTEGSVEPTFPVTFDDKKATINFEVDLNLPGEFYEFTVDIVNKGTLGASLDTFTKTTLTTEQQKYLNFTATYVDGEPIVVGDFLDKDKSLSIKVRIEYVRYSNENEVVPSTDQYIDLNLAFKFVQDDGLTKDFMKRIKLNAKVDDFVNFGNAPSSTNGQGVMIKADTKNDENPIYYYRGNVDNNNVRWANKCWKIIRTTDTGGVKMIYNGLPAADGSCNNSGSASVLPSTSSFNSNLTPAAVGYMYGSVPTVSEKYFYDYTYFLDTAIHSNYSYYNSSTGSSAYASNSFVYSSDVSWDEETGMYTLNSPSTSYTYVYSGYYTCGGSSLSCSSVKYVFSSSSRNQYSGNYTDYYSIYTYKSYSDGELRDSSTEPSIVLCSSYSTKGYQSNNVYYYYYVLSNCNTYNYSSFSTLYNSYYYGCSDLTSSSCTFNSSPPKKYIFQNGYQGMYVSYGFYEDSNVPLKFASDVTYSDGSYKLVNPVSYVWRSSYSSIADNYPYSCFSDSDSCETVNYVFNGSSSGVKSYVSFSDGAVMNESYLNSMFTNNNSSNIKNYIDSWYESDLLNYSSLIEDTVYCNDRSYSLNGGVLSFDATKRINNNSNINFNCSNLSDSFSVSDEIGNGLLTYPVGLITVDEAFLAGAKNATTYLSGSSYWTMTPAVSYNSMFYLSGTLGSNLSPSSNYYVRPVISIKGDFTIKGGNGSVNNPFSIV